MEVDNGDQSCTKSTVNVAPAIYIEAALINSAPAIYIEAALINSAPAIRFNTFSAPLRTCVENYVVRVRCFYRATAGPSSMSGHERDRNYRASRRSHAASSQPTAAAPPRPAAIEEDDAESSGGRGGTSVEDTFIFTSSKGTAADPVRSGS